RVTCPRHLCARFLQQRGGPDQPGAGGRARGFDARATCLRPRGTRHSGMEVSTSATRSRHKGPTMNPPRISMLCLVAVVAILGLLLLGPPGTMADPIFATVLGTKRVSDIPGFAPVLDPNLVNPIGITASAGSPDWVANNGPGVATLYDPLGQRQA